MKLLPLFGALFLSASPAFADDFLYLECDGTMRTIIIDADTSEVLNSVAEESTELYKIDIKNSQFTAPRNDNKPIDAEIKSGQLIVTQKQAEGSFVMKVMVDPPGELSGRGSMTIMAEG